MKETGGSEGQDVYAFKRIGTEALEEIRELFFSVFTAEPWLDDWSDGKQLELYLRGLIGQSVSLTFGLYEGEKLIGVSMGSIKYWYTGTEYYIDELCVRTDKQGQGVGTLFLEEIEKAVREMGLTQIFLQTEADVPAYRFYLKNGFTELKTHVSFAKRL